MADLATVTTTAGVEPAFDLSTYFPIYLYLVAVILFAVGSLVGSHFVGPRKRNTAVKLMPYESGVDPIGDARIQFDIKFYLIAILFLVFDVELLFLYPWAVIANGTWAGPHWRAELGLLVFIEILAFMLTLILAYIYAWRKEVFQWR
jgi:NADH:ubiquinone oxidoreductase subunit 3 (subunit A)